MDLSLWTQIYPPFSVQKLISTSIWNSEILDEYKKEIASCKERFWAAFKRAVHYIGEAKRVHDEVEGYYIPNMDFPAINAKRDEVLEKILSYAERV